MDEEDRHRPRPLKSIDKAAYADDPKTTAIVNDWQPISKTWGAPGQNTVFRT